MTEQAAATAPAASTPAAAAATVQPATPKTMPTFLAALTRTELFLVAGGALILLTDLIFIPLSGYGVSSVQWAASAILVMAVLFKSRMPAALAANYKSILIGLGALISLVAVRWLVGDLVWIGSNPSRIDGEYLLGMIGVYTGSALVAVATWQLWKGR
jgi:hypothetical protein